MEVEVVLEGYQPGGVYRVPVWDAGSEAQVKDGTLMMGAVPRSLRNFHPFVLHN
jgi:hypothetical protein